MLPKTLKTKFTETDGRAIVIIIIIIIITIIITDVNWTSEGKYISAM